MSEKYRVAVVLGNQDIKSANFDTLEECEDFVLFLMEKNTVKQYRILDKTTNQVIQTEKGDYKK